jgi:hypothetical protein
MHLEGRPGRPSGYPEEGSLENILLHESACRFWQSRLYCGANGISRSHDESNGPNGVGTVPQIYVPRFRAILSGGRCEEGSARSLVVPGLSTRNGTRFSAWKESSQQHRSPTLADIATSETKEAWVSLSWPGGKGHPQISARHRRSFGALRGQEGCGCSSSLRPCRPGDVDDGQNRVISPKQARGKNAYGGRRSHCRTQSAETNA